MDQGLVPNHCDHLCIDSHRVDSEGQCHQEGCTPPKYHHEIGVMSADVRALSEASYVLKTMKKDVYESVQVLPWAARQAVGEKPPA